MGKKCLKSTPFLNKAQSEISILNDLVCWTLRARLNGMHGRRKRACLKMMQKHNTLPRWRTSRKFMLKLSGYATLVGRGQIFMKSCTSQDLGFDLNTNDYLFFNTRMNVLNFINFIYEFIDENFTFKSGAKCL